jgi:hypothetical protein
VNDVNPFNTERILVGLRASAAVLLTCISLSPAFAAPDPPSPITEFGTVRVESRPVPGGGELYTYFGNESASGSSRDIPFLSILRDTLGDSDPTNDRLREVWAFTYGRPSVWKRLAAGIPFLYRRAGWRNVSDKTAPQPVIDLAAPAHGTGQKIAAALVQATVLDPLGIPWRAPTRAYRGRTDEYRMMHVWNAMSVLSEDTASGRVSPLSSQDLDLIQGRLLLSSRMPVDWWTRGMRKRRGARSAQESHNPEPVTGNCCVNEQRKITCTSSRCICWPTAPHLRCSGWRSPTHNVARPCHSMRNS